MATHTHMAPAHYFEPKRYHGVFSSVLSGFDPAVVDHLASRISEGIRDAYVGLQPACIGWMQREIPEADLQLNRSYVPYLANAPLDGATPPYPHPGYPETTRTPALPGSRPGAELAVDPTLTVLRVDRRKDAALSCTDSVPMPALAVF